jgi:hypothetical protein
MAVTEAQQALDEARRRRADLVERAATDPAVTGVDLVAAEADEQLANLRVEHARKDAVRQAETQRIARLAELRQQHVATVRAAQASMLDRFHAAQGALEEFVDAWLAHGSAAMAARGALSDSFEPLEKVTGRAVTEIAGGNQFLAEAVSRALISRGLEAGPFAAISGQLVVTDTTRPGAPSVDVAPSTRLAALVAKT